MPKKYLLLTTILFHGIVADQPVRIFTYVYNRPDFIELHVKTLQAFLKDEYEYIVFNDASNMDMKRTIEETCRRLNVQCIRVPDHAPHRQTPSYRHMDGIQYSLDILGYDYNGILVLLDADMFLIRPLSIKEYMRDHDFIGGYEYRCRDGGYFKTAESQFVNGAAFVANDNQVTYTSPCLVFMNMANLPNKRSINFDGDRVEGIACDVGGQSYYYFKNNPDISLKFYVAVSKDFLVTLPKSLTEYGFDTNSIDLIMNHKREYGFQFHGGTYFLHFYAGGSNWPGYTAEFVQQKTDIVNQYIDKQIQDYENQ
jgi:hypothetical protein